jgi:sec-independent protein translocase protein TatC
MQKSNRARAERTDNLTFFDHLEELRRRILFLLASVLVTSCFFFFLFNDLNLFRLFTAPLSRIHQKLYFQNLVDPFMARLKISLVLAVILNIPLLIYHALRFIFPALKQRERKTLLALLSSIVLLFFAGVFFADRVLLPYSIAFLIRFAGQELNPIIGLREYINLYIGLMIANGLIFLFPVLILFLSRMKLVTYQYLLRHIPEALVIILIVAAIITPTTDMVSQIILTIPLFLLYLISIGLAWLSRERGSPG